MGLKRRAHTLDRKTAQLQVRDDGLGDILPGGRLPLISPDAHVVHEAPLFAAQRVGDGFYDSLGIGFQHAAI